MSLGTGFVYLGADNLNPQLLLPLIDEVVHNLKQGKWEYDKVRVTW